MRARPGWNAGRWKAGLAGTLALVTACAALAITQRTTTSAAPEPRPVTLEAALASFGGSSDFFLKIPGIVGDSTLDNHPNEIDVQKFSWSVTNSAQKAGAGAFGNLSVTKYVDPSSPPLMKAAAAATTLSSVTLTADKPGAEPFEYTRLTLTNAKVVSFKQAGDAADGILETVTFSYKRLTLRFFKQSNTGGSTEIRACWDLLTKAAC